MTVRGSYLSKVILYLWDIFNFSPECSCFLVNGVALSGKSLAITLSFKIKPTFENGKFQSISYT